MNINLTLIAAAIVFAIFIWVTMKFIWPPLMAAIEERQKTVADGLAAAERGMARLKDAESESHEILKKARGQGADIISQSEKQAAGIINESKVQAKKEGDRLIEEAKASVKNEVQQAKSTLEGKVSALVLAATAQILGREVNAANHDQFLQQLKGKL